MHDSGYLEVQSMKNLKIFFGNRRWLLTKLHLAPPLANRNRRVNKEVPNSVLCMCKGLDMIM
jgi:hypothetical protein